MYRSEQPGNTQPNSSPWRATCQGSHTGKSRALRSTKTSDGGWVGDSKVKAMGLCQPLPLSLLRGGL